MKVIRQISEYFCAAGQTQPFILPKSGNEYQKISELTPGHEIRGLLPSTTTGRIIFGYHPRTVGGMQIKKRHWSVTVQRVQVMYTTSKSTIFKNVILLQGGET